MKIRLITIGKTTESYLRTGIQEFQSRLAYYTDFSILELNEIKGSKKTSIDRFRQLESEVLLPHLRSKMTILLDEKGKKMTSFEFARFLNDRMIHSTQSIDFVVGGPFGFDNVLREKSDFQLSLSTMTFSHQMVRLFFVEQLYRAMTIIKGEKYHNN